MTEHKHKFRKLLRLPEVCERTGLSKSTIYRQIDKEKFPEKKGLTDFSRGWRESDIDEWIATRPTVKHNRKTID